jgi:hypothetical protein
MTANGNSIAHGRRPRAVLARILDTPDLVRVVQQLQPRALARVIDAVGLEDAGEIAALMTARQLEAVFDHDLWHAEKPGDDEAFDADRFVLWLAVMREAGDEYAARKLLELDEDLVTLALSRQMFVLDGDELAREMSARRGDEGALLEKALESSQSYELDRFFLVARSAESFETIVQLLVTLDRDEHDFVERLLERCCALTRDAVAESDGLYELLTEQQELASDVAAARGDRREREGYVSAADARAFLALARATVASELLAGAEQDAITNAYFRALSEQAAGASAARGAQGGAIDDQAQRLNALIEEAVADQPRAGAQPRALPRGGATRADAPRRLERAIDRLARSDARLHALRVEELAYLANVLLAGHAYRGRALRPVEAAQLAMIVCERGAARIGELQRVRGPLAARIAQAWSSHSAVHAFRIGWRALHDELAHTPGRTIDDVLDERRD